MKQLTAKLTLGSLVLAFLGLLIGPAEINPLEAVAALFGAGDPDHRLIIQSIRLPRIVAAFLVGGALAMAGGALQGLLRNPLAEPGVLGVTASGLFGATLALAFGIGQAAVMVPLSAIAGAVAATALIALVALRVRSIPTLILFGIGLSSLVGAVMSLVLSLAPTPFTLAEIVNWSFGTVENRSWRDLAIAAPFLVAGTALLYRSRHGHTVLSLGEEAASATGLDLSKHRMQTVLGAGLATGAAISVAGGIGFVGIVAPHIIRPLTRHDPGASLLPSFVAGGAMLLAADLLLRVAPGGGDLRLGVLTALVGAPAFIWIALQRRGSLS